MGKNGSFGSKIPLSVIIIMMSLWEPLALGFSSRYEKLLQPIDIYAAPADAKKLISKQELLSILNSSGLPIKIAKESLRGADETRKAYTLSKVPKIGLNLSQGRTVTDVRESELAGASQSNADNRSATVTVGGDVVQGVNYSLSLPKLSQTRTSAAAGAEDDSPTVSTSAAVEASLGISLLKGSYFLTGQIPGRRADLDQLIAKETYRNSQIQATLQGEQAFYDLVQKYIRQRIVERSMASAQALLADVIDMVKAGEADRLSLVKAKVQVSQAEIDLLTSQSDFAGAREAFRELLGVSAEDGVTIFPDPSELKVKPEMPKIVPSEAVDVARKNRPDFRLQKLNASKSKLDVDAAFSNLLPQLDFKSSVASAGRDTVTGESINKARDFRDRQISLVLELSYTFTNFSERSAYRQARIAAQKATFETDQLTRKIVKEIGSLQQKIDIGFRRLKISEINRELAEEKLQAEYSKFKVGESGIRNVIDFQGELLGARVTELNSRVEVMLALSQYRGALGASGGDGD